MLKIIKKQNKIFCTVLYTILSATPILAFASDFGGEDDVLSKTLNGLIGLVTGGWARAIATLCIIAIGYALMSGKMEKQRAVFSVVGIGIVFSAAYILKAIGISS